MAQKRRLKNPLKLVFRKSLVAVGNCGFLGVCLEKNLVPTAHQLLTFGNDTSCLREFKQATDRRQILLLNGFGGDPLVQQIVNEVGYVRTVTLWTGMCFFFFRVSSHSTNLL